MATTDLTWTKLSERSLISIEGDGVREFLQRLITCDCTTLSQDEMAYGALLTPQGKILYDFFIFPTLQGMIIDVAEDQCDALIKKLTLYRLRSPITITPNDDIMGFACHGQDKATIDVMQYNLKAHRIFQDPRHKQMGCRIYGRALPKITADTEAFHYHQKRIQLGIPELNHDYDSQELFPHEVLMDQYQGASNITGHKGCYVGQEVVSRMKHRGTVRKRMVKLLGENLPPKGTDILAGEKKIGQIGSHFEENGLGLIRLDRLIKAQDENLTILSGESPIHVELPQWVNFKLNDGKNSDG